MNNFKVGKSRAKARYGRASGRPGVAAKGHAGRARSGLWRAKEQPRGAGKNVRRRLRK
jgi:hypothetical protein